MPGDGITDVGPIAQNQEKGRSASLQYRRRVYGDSYFDGWIELLWEWGPGIQDASNYPFRVQPTRWRDWRIPQRETRDEWLFAPTVANVAAQWPGEQDHTGQMYLTRKNAGLPRQYRPSIVSEEETIDPTTVSNIATWLPAVSTGGMQEGRIATRMSLRQNNPFMTFYVVLQVPQTSYYTQVTEIVGNTQITGGHFVFP